MTIGGHTLTPEEERRVLSIHERLSAHFPSARIDFQEEIIGIGEEGRYRFCYFELREGALLVKFKLRSRLSLDDEEAIERDINATVALFRATEMTLPKRSRVERRGRAVTNRAAEAPGSPLSHPGAEAPDMQEDFRLYDEALKQIPEDKGDLAFWSCSVRLQNALYRNGISSIRGLREHSAAEISSLKNLGRKSFRELCEFLLSLAEGRLSEEAKEAIRKVETLHLITEKRPEPPIDPRDIPLAFEGDTEKYATLYAELLTHIDESASIKLQPREQAILRARLGIGEGAKSLEEIGDTHGVTRERIRQLLKKSMRKLLFRRLSNEAAIALEHRGVLLADRIAAVTAGGFFGYLLLQNASHELIRFIATVYLRTEIAPSYFQAFRIALAQSKYQSAQKERADAFNREIYRAVTFPAGQRRITNEDFERLKAKAAGEASTTDLPMDEEPTGGRAEPEQLLFKRLLFYKTFRDVTVKALKIPFKNSFFYQDLQCLTHEGTLVLIEVTPLFNMCKSENIERFKVLREYCAKYGFGYLITDGRGNSFEDICEENPAFSEAVMAEIGWRGRIDYQKYREIYESTQATPRHLLALIKAHGLRFSSPPFALIK